jgi:hypothetical protein
MAPKKKGTKKKSSGAADGAGDDPSVRKNIPYVYSNAVCAQQRHGD